MILQITAAEAISAAFFMSQSINRFKAVQKNVMVFTNSSVKNNYFSAISTKNIVQSAYSIIRRVCDKIIIENIATTSDKFEKDGFLCYRTAVNSI